MAHRGKVVAVSLCTTREEFVSAFRSYAEVDGLFVPTQSPLQREEEAHLVVALRSGDIMIEGDVVVKYSTSRPLGVFHRPGMSVRFRTLHPDDQDILAQLVTSRANQVNVEPTTTRSRRSSRMTTLGEPVLESFANLVESSEQPWMRTIDMKRSECILVTEDARTATVSDVQTASPPRDFTSTNLTILPPVAIAPSGGTNSAAVPFSPKTIANARAATEFATNPPAPEHIPTPAILTPIVSGGVSPGAWDAPAGRSETSMPVDDGFTDDVIPPPKSEPHLRAYDDDQIPSLIGDDEVAGDAYEPEAIPAESKGATLKTGRIILPPAPMNEPSNADRLLPGMIVAQLPRRFGAGGSIPRPATGTPNEKQSPGFRATDTTSEPLLTGDVELVLAAEPEADVIAPHILPEAPLRMSGEIAIAGPAPYNIPARPTGTTLPPPIAHPAVVLDRKPVSRVSLVLAFVLLAVASGFVYAQFFAVQTPIANSPAAPPPMVDAAVVVDARVATPADAATVAVPVVAPLVPPPVDAKVAEPVAPDAAYANPQPAVVIPPQVSSGSGDCKLEVSIKPDEAILFAGTNKLGLAKATHIVPCGIKDVTFEHPRYEKKIVPVSLQATAPTKMKVVMERPKFSASITSSPSGASVSVNGVSVGKTPVTATLRGFEKNRITVSKDGQSKTVEKNPKSNGTVVDVKL